jgi:uncharacterized protein YdeI (YjbR/CyaY-like superfamily)
LRFKRIDRIAKITRKSATKDQKDHSRQIELPIEFENILSKNSRARKFFDSLSYTNRKEYALWISTAKKPETKHKRLESVILKLLAQKKNPSEK